MYACRCSRDPGRAPPPDLLSDGRVAFHNPKSVGLCARCISGLNRNSLRPRCLRFAAGVTPEPRKTRFRAAGQPYPSRVILQDSKEGFSFYISSSFSKLSWRTKKSKLIRGTRP